MKKTWIVLFVLIGAAMFLPGCTVAPYADYNAVDIEVKSVPFEYDNEGTAPFAEGKMEMLNNYSEYANYGFGLDYTEEYFARNDLLVFSVNGCSSDEMEFSEVLQKEGKLYPLFYRNKIGEGEPVTEDIIVLLFCMELPKEAGFSAGDILYLYR